VLDQERIDGDPEARVDPLTKRLFRRLGRLRADDAEPVRDPMDVRIDRDRRDPVAEDQHAVRRLRTDARQRNEFLVGTGNDPAESVEDLSGHHAEHPCLHAVEPGRPDERLDLGALRAGEGGRVREPGEEARARRVGVRIPRPLGEDRADQHLERVLGVVAEVRSTPIPRPVELAQPVKEALPIEAPGGSRSRHRDPLRAPVGPTGASRSGATPGSERSGSSASASWRWSSPIR